MLNRINSKQKVSDISATSGRSSLNEIITRFTRDTKNRIKIFRLNTPNQQQTGDVV